MKKKNKWNHMPKECGMSKRKIHDIKHQQWIEEQRKIRNNKFVDQKMFDEYGSGTFLD